MFGEKHIPRFLAKRADPMAFAEAVAKAIAADDTLYAEIAKYVDLGDQHMVNVLVKDALKAMMPDDDEEPDGDETYGFDQMGRSQRASKVQDPTGMLTSGTGLPRPVDDEEKRTNARKTGGRLDGAPFVSRKSRHGGRIDGRRI